MKSSHKMQCIVGVMLAVLIFSSNVFAGEDIKLHGVVLIEELQPLNHNPFARSFQKQSSTHNRAIGHNSQLILKAILYDEHKPLANIDGAILSLGESHQGHVLKAITRSSVTLEKAGSMTQIYLEKEPHQQEQFADIITGG